MVWDSRFVRWYMDGQLMHNLTQGSWWTGAVDKATNPWAPFDKDFHLLINLAGTCFHSHLPPLGWWHALLRQLAHSMPGPQMKTTTAAC